jgi:fibronectin-binding autotransporter adhesin
MFFLVWQVGCIESTWKCVFARSFKWKVQKGVIMKRIGLMVLLALALPMAAFAGNVDFTNNNGMLSGSSAGLILIGSQLTGVEGLGLGTCSQASSCGSVSFSTGSLISTVGNVTSFNGGGRFDITGNGTDGMPKGIIFKGTFNGPVTLTLVSSAGGQKTYAVTGSITGTWYNGQTVNGSTAQLYLFTGKNGWMGCSYLGSGNTIVNVPEPGTLGLLGTGLVCLAGIVRKKMKA